MQHGHHHYVHHDGEGNLPFCCRAPLADAIHELPGLPPVIHRHPTDCIPLLAPDSWSVEYDGGRFSVDVTFRRALETTVVSSVHIVARSNTGRNPIHYSLNPLPDSELGAALAEEIEKNTHNEKALSSLLPTLAKLVASHPDYQWTTIAITKTGPRVFNPEGPPEALSSPKYTPVLSKLVPAFNDLAEDPSVIDRGFTVGLLEHGNRVRIDAFLYPQKNNGALRFRTFDPRGVKLREEMFNFEGTPSSSHETSHNGLLMRMCSILHQYSPHGIAGVRKAATSAHMESFQRGFETGQEQRERIELGVLDPARCESVTILPSGAQIWLEVAESVASLQIKASGRSNATSTSWVVREDSGSREDFEHKVQKLRDAINPLQSINDRTVIRTVELLDRLADQPRPFQMKAAPAALSLGKDVVAAIKAIEGLRIEGVYAVSANQVVQLLAGHEVVDIYFANGQISTDRPANFCNLRIAIGPRNDARVRLSNLMRGRVQAYLSQDACTSHGGVGETALRLSRAFAEQLQSSRLRPQSQLEQLADQDPSRSWCLSEGDGIGLDMPHGRDVAGNLAYDNAGLLVKEYRKIKPAPPYQLTVQYNGLGMCLASLEDQENKTSLLLTVSSKGISGIVASAPMLSDPTRSEQFEWFGGVERSVPILATQELSVLLRLFQSFSVDRMTAESPSIHDSLLAHFIRNVVLKSQIEAA